MSNSPRDLIAPPDGFSRVKQWVLEKNGKLSDIGLDEDLIDGRIIDSLEFVDFVLFIEEVRGGEIPDEQITPIVFGSLRSIRDVFFPGGAG